MIGFIKFEPVWVENIDDHLSAAQKPVGHVLAGTNSHRTFGHLYRFGYIILHDILMFEMTEYKLEKGALV